MDLADNMKWSIEKPTPYSWRLRIKGLELQDEGNYTCFVVLTNNNNRVMDNRTVIVTDKPIILEEFSSSDMTVKEGDSVPLRCNASGRPYPQMMWRREGNAILPGGGVVVMGPSLDIENIQYDARGNYICEALNEVGSAIRNILLQVTHSPKVKADSSEFGQKQGYSRMLVCYIDANPAPQLDPEINQLYWSYGVQRISNTDPRYTIRILEGAYGRLTYELIVNEVTSSDFGVYSCNAANVHGSNSASMNLVETQDPIFDRSWLLLALSAPSLHLNIFVILFSLFIVLLIQ